MAREKTKARKKNSTILRSVTISLGDVVKFSQTTSRARDNDVSLFLAVGETKINLLFNAPSSGRCPPVDRGFSRGEDDGITMETKSPLFYSLSRVSMSRQGKKEVRYVLPKKKKKYNGVKAVRYPFPRASRENCPEPTRASSAARQFPRVSERSWKKS